jgi:stearoyl-CoA desaturase (delta-9 desaturase)
LNNNQEVTLRRGISSGENAKAFVGQTKNVVKDDDEEFPPLQIVWRNVGLFIYLHTAAAYGAYLWLSGQVMWQTFIWGFILYCMCGFGITAGAHRLWTHKSYKAKLPLRIILCICQTVAFQNHIYEWSRDHRMHHKYSETHADPHNAKRGFFFAHIGWLMCRKHESVKEKGKGLDMSDLEQDSVVVFQKKYYIPLVLSACFFIPTLVPYLLWNEKFVTAWFFAAQFRYCITLHMTWLVNSAAHLWGDKPYDININPSENTKVAFWAFGEGWHNYHHVFPWDYKTEEVVGRYRYNFSAAFIDFFAWIGWAYDLKTVPKTIVDQRVKRTGPGSKPEVHDGPWGWGDEDIPAEDIKITQILYARKNN